MWRIIVGSLLLVTTIITKSTNARTAVLPHDVYPGFEVIQFSNDDKHHDVSSNYRLLETGYSKYFTVLDNGMVMTTSDLTPLVNKPVNLIVLEELNNHTETHDLHLFIINRGNMLKFSHEKLGHGEVMENLPSGTIIDEFPILHAHGNFPVHYKIMPDINGDYLFALTEESSSEIGYNLTLKRPDQGVRVVTTKPLDREIKKIYTVVIYASDGNNISTSKISGIVNVLDDNDNSPIFENEEYNFNLRPINIKTIEKDGIPKWKRFASIGKVIANDADGDKIAYKLLTPTNLIIIVPQTGELLLAGEPDATIDEDSDIEVLIEAHDIRVPSKSTKKPARVIIRFLTTEPLYQQPQVHRIQKRRVTRAVRPTKKVEFLESEGDIDGKIVFSLEKETERETYKIRDENPWVTVASNGSVKVKQKWDYEELGPEKTIDFWVTINNQSEFLRKKKSI